MGTLQHKTRGNSSVQGKGRVYFSCHPEDFDTYFEMVSKDILEKQNCVIWYDKEPESAWDEQIATDISHMRLMVIPVTARLLNTPNRTMQYEFPYAIEQNIPVLPILMDISLEKEFNQHFGNLQWLNPYEMDSTAISYEKKLEKYLDGVLLGEELRERIRQEFKGYIFFSYRKMDRKYARELMRKIHDRSNCRDLAIWYDEYLVPGEKFDKSIMQAMKKSDIFLLMVTPNLLIEGNYVLETEYPEAKRMGKSIVPVEVEETDRDLLLKHYKGLSNLVSMKEAYKIGVALDDIIYEKEIKGYKDTPEHLYYMGLAYLAGVDVEVDGRRAVKLIQKSAEAGYRDAIKKMVSMYENGEAVIRDYKMATLWQKKLIEEMQKEYDSNKAEELGIRLVDEYRKLSRVYENEIMDTPTANEFLAKAEAIAIEIDCELGRWSLAAIYLDQASAEHDWTKRRELYEKALSYAETLNEEETQYDHKGLQAGCYSGLAECMEKQELHEQALEYYEQALNLYHLVAEETESEIARYHFATAYLNMANCLLKAERNMNAKAYLLDGYDVVEILVKEYEKPYIQVLYTHFVMRLAEVYKKTDDISQAIQYARYAEEYAEKLVEKDGTVQSIQLHKRAALYLAELYKNVDGEKAKKYTLKALEAINRLLQYNNTDTYDIDQAIECIKRASEYEVTDDKENQEWYCEQALDILEKMQLKKSEAEIYYEIIKKAYNYGCDYAAASDGKKAVEYFKRAAALSEKLIQVDRSEIYLEFCADSNKAVAVVQWEEYQHMEACIYYGEAAALYKELYELTKNSKYYGEYEETTYREAWAANNVAQLWEDMGIFERIEANYKKAKEKLIEIDMRTDMLAGVCCSLAEFYWQYCLYEAAVENYIMAEEIFTEIVKRKADYIDTFTEDECNDIRNAIILDLRLVDYEKTQENYEGACHWLERAVEMGFLFCDATHGREAYATLANVIYQLYEIKKLQEDDEADEYLKLYYKVMKELV